MEDGGGAHSSSSSSGNGENVEKSTKGWTEAEGFWQKTINGVEFVVSDGTTGPAGWAWRKFHMEDDKHIGDNQVGHSDEFHDHDIEEYRSNIHSGAQHKILSFSYRDRSPRNKFTPCQNVPRKGTRSQIVTLEEEHAAPADWHPFSAGTEPSAPYSPDLSSCHHCPLVDTMCLRSAF